MNPNNGAERVSKAHDPLERIKSDLAARNFHFVDPMPEEVQTDCCICFRILEEPYIMGCCGNRFCKVCIERAMRSETAMWSRQPCPLCKQRHFQMMPDRQLQRLLRHRKVFCLLKEEGCSWIGELDKLQKHLRLQLDGSYMSGVRDVPSCQYVPVVCRDCESVFTRQNILDHKKTCHMREVVCTHCDMYTCFPSNLPLHHAICPSFPVQCPHSCSLRSYKRIDLKAHLRSTCPLHRVRCVYHFAGCEGHLLRREMPHHMEANAKEHLSLVTSKYKDLEAKYNNIKKNTTELKATKFLYVSNLPPTVHEQMLHSRFGQFGVVSNIDIIPSKNAAVIEFASDDGYTRALSASRFPVNLLQHSLAVTLMYSSPRPGRTCTPLC